MQKKQMNGINLYRIVGAIVFILWTMGKVPYHWIVWAIPLFIGCVIDGIDIWAKTNKTES